MDPTAAWQLWLPSAGTRSIPGAVRLLANDEPPICAEEAVNFNKERVNLRQMVNDRIMRDMGERP